MSVTTRDELQRIRSELADLRRQRAEQRRGIADLRDAAASSPSESAIRNVTAAQRAETDLSERIEELREREAELLHGLSANGNGAGGIGGMLADRLGDPTVQAELAQIAHSSGRIGGDRLLGEIDRHTVAGWFGRALAATPTPGMTQRAQDRVVPLPTPVTRFLDLIPSGTTDQGSIPYAAEVRTDDGDVGPVEPGALKPQISIEWEDKEAAVTTIAGWLKINRPSLADTQGLQQTITTRVIARVLMALEGELLTGDGTTSDRPGTPGIVGLLNTNGVATVPAGADLLDAAVDAIVAIEAVGGTANLFALNLNDWADLIRTKTSGSGEYVFPPTAQQQRVWNLTMTPTVALPPGRAVVADSRAMSLLVRESAQVRVGEESDDFVRNRLTLLGEMRAAFCVWQPALIALIEPE